MDKQIKEYITKGHELLKEKYWTDYDRIVPIRVNDLYGGMEVGAFLEVIECYEKHKDLDKCYTVFEKQGHSGMSASLVASMIYRFHDEGDKIVRKLGFKCKDKERNNGQAKAN